MITLNVNGTRYDVDVAPETPLLWVLRDVLDLKGTKYGCGVAACGACTVHLDGEAQRSCQWPVGDLENMEITTIEGLGTPESPHPVQAAWIEHQVAQCGYCQSGQIMQAASLLAADPEPDEQAIIDAMDGNLCRCGTYPQMRSAIKSAARILSEEDTSS